MPILTPHGELYDVYVEEESNDGEREPEASSDTDEEHHEKTKTKIFKKDKKPKAKMGRKTEQLQIMNIVKKKNNRKRMFRGVQPVDPNRAGAVEAGAKDLKAYWKKEQKKKFGTIQKASFSALYSQGQHEIKQGHLRQGIRELSKVS